MIGASIASGGFYVGLAHAQTGPVQTSGTARPNFDKVPRLLPFLLLPKVAKGLGLGPAVLQKVQAIRSELLPLYIEARKRSWETNLSFAEKEERGEAIRVEMIAYSRIPIEAEGHPTLGEVEHQANKRVDDLLTSDQKHRFHLIASEMRVKDQTLAVRLLGGGGLKGSLELTPKQNQQMSLVLAAYAFAKSHKTMPRVISTETMGELDDAKNLESLLSDKEFSRVFAYYQMQAFLSPLQQIKFQAILDNQVNARP